MTPPILDPDEVQRFRDGDPAVFERIVAHYQDGLYRLCTRMTRDRDEAMDLAQDCFLRIYTKASLYDPAFPLTPWIYQLATRVALNHLDRKKRRPERRLDDTEGFEPAARSPTAGEDAARAEDGRALHAALDRLSPDDAIVLRLRYLGDLDLGEVAFALGITVQATKTRLFRARARLKDLLDEEDRDETRA